MGILGTIMLIVLSLKLCGIIDIAWEVFFLPIYLIMMIYLIGIIVYVITLAYIFL